MTTALETLRRGFVDVAAGQVHYRSAGRDGPRPLVLLHASPGSSRTLDPLTARLGATRRVIAPDTLGNGDSSPPPTPSPRIEDFAAGTLAALDGLGIGSFDLYGTHTGAGIAAEIAIAAPQRVRRLVLDGVGLYPEEDIAEMLARYAPALEPDLEARYVLWIWHFVRDTYSFWPWYHRDAAHARTVGLPPADVLHDKFVDVLKATRTYHLSYRASIAQRKRDRFPLIGVPTLVACARHDMLFRWHDEVASLIPGAHRAVTGGIGSAEAADRTAATIAAFLDAA
jgi:pimeloyl-ACP methyl ester carboxylesterase